MRYIDQIVVKRLIVAIFIPLTGLAQKPPSPRHLEEIAFDSHRNILALFGGIEMEIGKEFTFPNYLSEWDGENWTNSGAKPDPNNFGHALIYHPNERKFYLFGGVNQNEHTISTGVWTYDGMKWQRVNEFCPVKSAEAAMDPIQDRILVYGETYRINELRQKDDPVKLQLWELKENSWTLLSDKGPQIDYQFEVSFDTGQNALVIPAWEDNKSVVWQWKDGHWSKITATGSGPGFRNRYALAYNPSEKGTFMFGGRNNGQLFLNEFWKWNGKNWVQIVSKEMPYKRAAATMEFANKGLLLYGGVVEGGHSNEIWRWRKGRWKLMNPATAIKGN